jgi:hypothetical protein
MQSSPLKSWVIIDVPLLLGVTEEVMRVDDPVTDEAVDGAEPSDIVVNKDEVSFG